MKKSLVFALFLSIVCGLAWGQKKQAKKPAKPAPQKPPVVKPMPAPTPPVTAPAPAPTPEIKVAPLPAMTKPTPPPPVGSVFGANETKNLPTAEEILEKYFKADGTDAVKDTLKTRVITGNMEIMGAGISGSMAIYQKAPNLFVSDAELPQLGNFKQGFDGQFGWAKDNISGLRNLNGGELSQVRIGAQFNPRDTQKLFGEMKVKGVEKVGERDAYVVVFTVISGSPLTNFFDTETGLLLRTDAELDTPQGTKLATQTFYSEYKSIDGVQIPHFTRIVNPAFTIEMRYYSVKHNIEVDDKRFQKPLT
jgi:hypothetical protein